MATIILPIVTQSPILFRQATLTIEELSPFTFSALYFFFKGFQVPADQLCTFPFRFSFRDLRIVDSIFFILPLQSRSDLASSLAS